MSPVHRALANAQKSTTSGKPSMVITTPCVDREGDQILPEGGDFTNFNRNPILCWGHDYHSLPIGRVETLDVTPGVSVRASWKWFEGDPFASRVKSAYEQGIVNACSIGFTPRAVRPNASGGRDVTKWELLELSLVSVPMNPEATRALKALDLTDAHAGRPTRSARDVEKFGQWMQSQAKETPMDLRVNRDGVVLELVDPLPDPFASQKARARHAAHENLQTDYESWQQVRDLDRQYRASRKGVQMFGAGVYVHPSMPDDLRIAPDEATKDFRLGLARALHLI